VAAGGVAAAASQAEEAKWRAHAHGLQRRSDQTRCGATISCSMPAPTVSS
jgi:hypothetical protein